MAQDWRRHIHRSTGIAAAATAVLLCTEAGSVRAQTPASLGCGLEAGPERSVAAVLDGETVRLDDGKVVRLIGALAPRHVLIIAPLKDSNFQHASVDRIAAAARPVFKLHGHEDRLQIEHPDCEHDFPNEMRQRAYKLFDEVLK